MNTRVLTLFIGGVLSLAFASSALAQANIAVNTLVDKPDFDILDGVCDCDVVLPGPQCSLRAAVQNANQLGGWVIISLGAQVYGLSFGGTDDAGVAGDLDIFSGTLSRLDINGAPGTVVSGAGLIAGGTPDRIFHITNSVANLCEINFTEVSIQSGAGVSFGAGLNQQGGRVTLSNVWFDDCTANDSGGGVHTSSAQRFHHTGGGYGDCDAALNGGGIYLDNPAIASVQLTGLNFFNCDVTNLGGAVRVSANTVATMSNCSVGSANTADSGGGISNRGTLTVNDSFVVANFASGTGGGITNNIGGTLNLNRCTVNQNQAGIGGGINNSSTANIVDCTIRLNNADTGGGISNAAAAGTPLAIRNSTISANFATGASGGGGYRGFGAMEMINCTMSFNGAQAGSGGAMYFDGGLATVHVNASTIANNFGQVSGGALFTTNGFGVTPIIFRNSIVSSNTIGGGFPNNFFGAIPPTSNGFNIDSDGTCGFLTASDLNGVNPMLGRLQNNGGPTDTRELLAGSPAINSGTCTTIAGNTFTTDQRGFLRNTPCDRGAYEANALPPPPNDLCAMAPTIGPGSLLFPHFGANTDGPPEACGFTGLPGQDSDVWFKFTPTCSGTATISVAPVAGSNPNRLLAIYSACPTIGGGPLPIVCASSVGGPPATGTINLVAGQSYVIRAGMTGGNQGDSTLDITVTCDCPADINNDNSVNVTDLLAVIGSWGVCVGCPPPGGCPGDIAPIGPPQGDCLINVSDLLLVISAWGPCP